MPEFPCPCCQKADVPAGATRCPGCGEAPVVCGRFRIDELLGKGGMGVVYSARDESGGRGVAVKLVALKGGADWKIYELFERSTNVLLGLDHPALPKLYAFEKTAAGNLVLVRERFDGGSLEQRVLEEKRPVGAAELRKLLESQLELLAYLHGRNPPVLHRDIKASNLMFRARRDWDAVLVDFDTIAAPGSQVHRTTLVVSPGYTAPEQYAGDVSPASDLYSLGATMLLAATGTHPDELPRRDGRFVVDGLLGRIDADVRRVMLRLVEPQKADRYARAEEALDDLRKVPPAPAKGKHRARKAVDVPRPVVGAARPAPKERKAEKPAPVGEKGKPPATARHRLRRLWMALTWAGSAAVGTLAFVVPGELVASFASTACAMGAAAGWLVFRKPPAKDSPLEPLVWTGVLAAIIAGIMVGQYYYWSGIEADELLAAKRTARGRIEEAIIVPGSSATTARLALIEDLRIEYDDYHRMDVVDAAGTRVARRAFGEESIECTPTARGRMWCEIGAQPLVVLDTATLATVADEPELRRLNPGLGADPVEKPTIDTQTGEAFVLQSDGRLWRLAIDTLRGEPLSPAAAEELAARKDAPAFRQLGYGSNSGTTNNLQLADAGYLAFDDVSGGRRRVLTRDGAPISQDDFLEPEFVLDALTGEALRPPGTHALLVLHSTSLDAKAAQGLLSAVTTDGRTLWTIDAPVTDVVAAFVAGDIMVLAGKRQDELGLVFALDAAGAVRWRLDT